MKALVLLLLASIAQHSSCDERNMTQIWFELFGPPNSEKNDPAEATTEENFKTCGFYSGGGIAVRMSVEEAIPADSFETQYAEYNWMVALFTRRRDFHACEMTEDHCWKYTSGGSLINMNVVLTAAHSVLGNTTGTLKARAGDWDLHSKLELYPYHERLVKAIIIHDRYKHSNDASKIQYDAALLVLETPFHEASNIGTICLPPPDLVMSSAQCKVTGWGNRKYRSARMYQDILKVVNLEYVDHGRCQAALSKVIPYFRLHESFTCAGGDAGKDACQGDGGSPLMCLDDDYYYQRGVVSWGVGCGRPDVPGVYSDVVKIRGWIDDQMKLNGFNPKSYIYEKDAVLPK